MNHAAKTTPQTRRRGFTLIELMLAMGFVAFLLLAIATTVIQISVQYSKGLAVKELNQTSRDIANDFRRDFTQADGVSLTTDYINTSAGGRVCLGSFTYLWNTTKALEVGTDSNLVRYLDASSRNKQIKFVKVPDADKLYCVRDMSGGLVQKDIIPADTTRTQELLPVGDYKVGINGFTLSTQASAADPATGQRLYSLTYILATGKTSTMTTDLKKCRATGDPAADPAYCNVRIFELVIRSGNERS